jgi:hypothetical protein
VLLESSHSSRCGAAQIDIVAPGANETTVTKPAKTIAPPGSAKFNRDRFPALRILQIP